MGGAIYVDFAERRAPEIRALPLDLSASGYRLCIVDTRGSHSELTEEFSAIRHEMEAVSHFFHKSVLREVQERQLLTQIAEVRKACGDRAALRAMHFFGECQRVYREYDCIRHGDFSGFLQLVRESGHSAIEYAQNAYCSSSPQQQPLSVALALSEHLLQGAGASRLQGTGFAGTIQAFVPAAITVHYCAEMNRVFGEGSCRALSIRSEGSMLVFA
jgi:galactokinase